MISGVEFAPKPGREETVLAPVRETLGLTPEGAHLVVARQDSLRHDG